MNDVPAVVGWIVAIIVGLAVGSPWLVLRHHAAPAAPRWRLRTVTWLLASSTIGPICVIGVIVVMSAVMDLKTLVRAPSDYLTGMMGTYLFLSVWYVAVAFAFFTLPYIPILFLWTRLGSRLGVLERSRRGIIASSILLALPATIVSVIAYGLQESPFGYHGWELARFGLLIEMGVSASLLVPRLVLGALQPGVFSVDERVSSNNAV